MRLLLITNIFPGPLLPTKGPFNLELVRALARHHAVRVVAPVAWTDELAARRKGLHLPAGRRSTPSGIPAVEVIHPRYYFTPKVLRGRYGWFMWRSVRAAVGGLIQTFRPDVVIGYWVHPDGEVAVRAARLAGVPSAVMVGGSDVLLLTRSAGRRDRILDVLHSADAVIPVSEDLKAKLVGFGVNAGKIHVVPRGVDTGRFAPGNKEEARRKLNIRPGVRALLWVGRMVPVKGLDVLLDALGSLRSPSGDLPFHLYLVGDGPLRGALQEQAARLGIHDGVTFVGSVAHAELADWYRAADLTVLPSRSEGVPNVLRESIACGTPFVASRVGGIPEITDEATCRLVPPEDAAALSAALAEMITVRGGGAAAGGGGVRQGSWEESAAALEAVLKRLVRRRAVGGGSADDGEPDQTTRPRGHGSGAAAEPVHGPGARVGEDSLLDVR